MEKNEEKLKKMQVSHFWPARVRARSSWRARAAPSAQTHGRVRSSPSRTREGAHAVECSRAREAAYAPTGRVRGMLGRENNCIWH